MSHASKAVAFNATPSDQPQAFRIAGLELEAVALRIKRDGVVTTYTMPPLVDGCVLPQATLPQARMYCVSALEAAQHKCRALPGDAMAVHEAAVFAGLVRLIDACTSSDVIKNELRRIAAERIQLTRGSAPE